MTVLLGAAFGGIVACLIVVGMGRWSRHVMRRCDAGDHRFRQGQLTDLTSGQVTDIETCRHCHYYRRILRPHAFIPNVGPIAERCQQPGCGRPFQDEVHPGSDGVARKVTSERRTV
jgi:hypothetical protein